MARKYTFVDLKELGSLAFIKLKCAYRECSYQHAKARHRSSPMSPEMSLVGQVAISFPSVSR